MVKKWKDLDERSKQKLENWYYKIVSQGLDVKAVLLMNQQDFILNNLQPKRVAKDTFDGYKRNIKQITLYPERFQKIKQLSVKKRFIKENITDIEVIDAYQSSGNRSFRKSKTKKFTTKKHIFLEKIESETTDYRIYIRYKFLFKQKIQRISLSNSPNVNNWFTQIEPYILNDVKELYENFSEILKLNQPKYLGVSLTFEAFDSRVEQYRPINYSGIRTPLRLNLSSMKNLLLRELIDLGNYFAKMNKSLVQYWIYESVIHLNLQSKK